LKKVALLFILSVSLNSCFLFGSPKPIDPIVTDKLILPEFNDAPAIFDVSENRTTEASGIAPARNFENCVWVIEDSNNEAGLHLMGNDGKYKSFVSMQLRNRDWEDIASGPGPIANENYVYVADIGDNAAVYGEYLIYRIPEPKVNQKEIINFETIKFHYPGRISQNAETLLLDPKTKDLYVISKEQFNVNVYKLAYPQALNADIEAELLGTIPYWLITAGDISDDGTEILLKSYAAVFYWKLKPNETIFQALSRPRDIGAPYLQENQGEAICWDLKAKGYFTISENLEVKTVQKLYYYSKK
jgi:hypothetical protein